MTTLKEFAENYEPITTKNVAELDKVPVNMEVLDGSGTDNDGKTFEYKYIIINNEQYRVPYVVIGQIKSLLKVKPEMQYVRVLREGSGIKTKYQVIPVD